MLHGLVDNRLSTLPEAAVGPSRSSRAPSPDLTSKAHSSHMGLGSSLRDEFSFAEQNSFTARRNASLPAGTG